jgi:hypothetical protein
MFFRASRLAALPKAARDAYIRGTGPTAASDAMVAKSVVPLSDRGFASSSLHRRIRREL